MKRLIAALAVLALSGCSLLPTASKPASLDASDNAGTPGVLHAHRFGASAIQLVNTGTAPNAGNGDTLYTAFTKENSNTTIFQNMFPSGGGIMVGTGSVPNPMRPATYNDMVALFTGCTSGTTIVMTTAGSCQTIVTGLVPISGGGTGQITAIAALTALLPSQTGQSGNCLGTNGTSASWTTCGSGGSSSIQFVTVTSNSNCTSGQPTLFVDATSGNIVVTVATAVGATWQCTIKRKDSSGHTITVQGTSAQTIEGQASGTIQYQNSSITLTSDNANWWIT